MFKFNKNIKREDIAIYDVKYSEDKRDGIMIYRNSLVNEPAVQVNKINFNKTTKLNGQKIKTNLFIPFNKTVDKFSADNNEELTNIFTGVSAITDIAILRYDAIFDQYYYIRFGAEELKKFIYDFVNSDRKNILSKHHSDNESDIIKSAQLVESFIVKDELKHSEFDVNNGSWITSYQFDSEEYKTLLTNDINGFSIEISMFLEETDYSNVTNLDEVDNFVNEINDLINSYNEDLSKINPDVIESILNDDISEDDKHTILYNLYNSLN